MALLSPLQAAQHSYSRCQASNGVVKLPAPVSIGCRYSPSNPTRPYINHKSQILDASGAQPQRTKCQATKARSSPAKGDDVKEAHKIFDEAIITVKSGDGGNGEIVETGRGKFVKNLKYHAGGNQPKQIWLPASEPADGADGADVVIVCDPSYDSLLHLHQRKVWSARKGGQGNPAVGSAGPKRNQDIKKASTPPLEVPVPPGTVIKRKSSGQVLGEVIQPGDRVVVVKGGKGGRGVRAPSRLQKQKALSKEVKNAQKAGAEVYAVEDINWKDDAKGLPGQQIGLQLLLRVVADVGLVGFPNAGKSSLLAALTRASPEVAPYPFTTLMPNLGVMAAGGEGPVLADLPGLIEGAHLGKGLGRMFLRHLRRTRLLLHVVDASAADPGTDYLAVREELRMYNPDYVTRPHVVALNKVDLEDAGALQQEITAEVMSAAHQLQQQHAADVPGLTAPAAVVPCSALSGEGLQELAKALQQVLQLDSHADQHQEPYPWELSAVQPAQLQQQQGQPQQQQQQDGSFDAPVDLAAAFSMALGVDVQSTEQEEWDEDEAEWEEWEEEVGDLEQHVRRASSSKQEDSDDEVPTPLAPNDTDAWLFDLSEKQLLELADKSEADNW